MGKHFTQGLYMWKNLTLFLTEFWQGLKNLTSYYGKTLYMGTSYPGNTVLHLCTFSFYPSKTHSKYFLQSVQRQLQNKCVAARYAGNFFFYKLSTKYTE